MLALIGTHGSGKTTLIKNIADKLDSFSLLSFIETNEIARVCPLPVNMNSSSKAQEWIFQTEIKMLDILCHVSVPVIMDRCLIDHYVYYYYWAKEDNEYLRKQLVDRIDLFTKIYFLPPNQNFLISDGVRAVDIQFQKDIDDIFYRILNYTIPNYKNIVYVRDNFDYIQNDILDFILAHHRNNKIDLEIKNKILLFNEQYSSPLINIHEYY